MALKILGFTLISTNDLRNLEAAAKAASATVVPWWEQEADKIVGALKTTAIGDMVFDSIKAINDANLSGSEKFSTVVSEIAPVVLNYARSGGLDAVVDDVLDLTRQLVQSVYNDAQSTTFGRVVTAIKKLLNL